MNDSIWMTLADSTRRAILDELKDAPCAVNDLVEVLGVSQPTVSKHLRLLRDSGLVSVQISGQQRIYSLESAAFVQLDQWLEPYRSMWNPRLAALGRHLDNKAQSKKGK